LQVGFIGLQLYREEKRIYVIYHFMYHQASCFIWHHVQHTLLLHV